jgi:hypothetical protein
MLGVAMRGFFAGLALLAGFSVGPGFGADSSSADSPFRGLTSNFKHQSEFIARPHSIFLFGGMLSATPLGSTLQFSLDKPPGTIGYDNYIAGAAYNYDFYQLPLGITLGAEVGVADRFGHYSLCCNTIVKSSDLVHSGELWIGPRFSNAGIVLFDAIRIAGAISAGLSFTTDSIGKEREREISHGGNARMLMYFGPEIMISMVGRPELEFVYRLHHRSGANGTFGKMHEGYNANVFGIRYKF